MLLKGDRAFQVSKVPCGDNRCEYHLPFFSEWGFCQTYKLTSASSWEILYSHSLFLTCLWWNLCLYTQKVQTNNAAWTCLLCLLSTYCETLLKTQVSRKPKIRAWLNVIAISPDFFFFFSPSNFLPLVLSFPVPSFPFPEKEEPPHDILNQYCCRKKLIQAQNIKTALCYL